MVLMVLAAADSLASNLDRSKLGTAIAAMIRMMATTISSSINEKPFCLRIEKSSSGVRKALFFENELVGCATQAPSQHPIYRQIVGHYNGNQHLWLTRRM